MIGDSWDKVTRWQNQLNHDPIIGEWSNSGLGVSSVSFFCDKKSGIFLIQAQDHFGIMAGNSPKPGRFRSLNFPRRVPTEDFLCDFHVRLSKGKVGILVKGRELVLRFLVKGWDVIYLLPNFPVTNSKKFGLRWVRFVNFAPNIPVLKKRKLDFSSINIWGEVMMGIL